MVFETEGILSFDASDYVSGASDAADASEDFAESSDEAAESLFEFDAAGAAAGGALAGVGTAMQAVLDDTQSLNETLGRTGVSMGLTTDETRDLATSMSDATFPLDDVTTTMDALAQIGVDTEEEMREVAEASDLLADATGTSATEIAEGLAPAVNALDGDLSALTDDADAFTEAVRNTGLEMSDVSSTIERLDFEQVEELGLSAADTADLIGQFGEETGFTGRVLRREFRSAVEDADGSTEDLVAELGLGEDAMESLADETSHGSEVTTEFGDAANESLTTTDELRSTFDDLKLQASGMLGPIDAAAPALQGLGVAALTLSTINFSAVIPSITGVVASLAPLLPILLAVTAVGGALAVLFGDEILDALEAVTDWITDELIPPIVELVEDGFQYVVDVGEDLVNWFDDAFGDDIQEVTEEAAKTFSAVAGRITDAIDQIVDVVEAGVEIITETFDDELEIVADLVDFYVGTWLDIFETSINNVIDVVSVGLSILRGDWEGALEGVKSIIERNLALFEDIWENSMEAIEAVVELGLNHVREHFASLRRWARKVFDLHPLSDTFRAVADSVMGGGSGIVPTLKADVERVFDDLRAWANNIWDLHPLSDTFEDAADTVFGGGSGIIPTLKSDVEGVLESLSDWAKNTWDWVKSLTQPFIDAKNAIVGSSIVPDMVSDIEKALEGLSEWVRNVWNIASAIADPFESATSTALSTVESFVSDAQSALNSLSMPSLEMPSMPSMPSPGSPDSGGSSGGSSGTRSGSTATGSMPGDSIQDRGSQRRAFAGVATGGFIEGDGPAMLHANERVLPESQVTDRGEASFDPDSVADGFDRSSMGQQIANKLDKIDSAIRDDGTMRISERDLVRALERLFDRHGSGGI